MPRRQKEGPAPEAKPVDPLYGAIHAFAIVHQQWANQESARSLAEELGTMWSVLLHDEFLRFCLRRGLLGGRILLGSEGRARFVMGDKSIDWGTRYYDGKAEWPHVAPGWRDDA